MGWGGALALALLLGACAPAGTSSDEFSAYATIDGPAGAINPLIGPKVAWQMESLVGKEPPHDVAHRVLVHVYLSDFFANAKQERETSHYQFAADDTAAPLKVVRIGVGSCGVGSSGCLKHETIAIPLADEVLRQRVLSGYRIKISPKEGQSEILTLSPAMIQQQLSKVDNMVQGGTAAADPGAPHLGIGVVAATAMPYAAAPRGVIIVVTTPKSPAAAAGIAPGDVLLAIDAQPIRVTADIARILSDLRSRHDVTLELERGGAPYSATLQL